MSRIEKDDEGNYYMKLPRPAVRSFGWKEGDDMKLVFKQDSLEIKKG